MQHTVNASHRRNATPGTVVPHFMLKRVVEHDDLTLLPLPLLACERWCEQGETRYDQGDHKATCYRQHSALGHFKAWVGGVSEKHTRAGAARDDGT